MAMPLQPEPKKSLDDRMFDFASRPAQSMTKGQKVLQGLLILALIVVFCVALTAGSWLISGAYWHSIVWFTDYWWAVPIVGVVALLALNRKSKG